ncbi:hypothetical protein BC629DRAFT_1597177 [Irpex lacteus]|nr:hypothetical protein BC629DRAFT_1597177 [Irpex lacteus]
MIDGNPDDQVQVPPQPQRSEKFYHLSGDIIIQVELTLYRLHRDILSKFSEAFEDILSLPGGEGRSDEKAFVLETIKQTDFDCLMGWIYEADLRHTPPGGSEHIHFTYETLVSILKLATLYQMAAARTWAIERIEAEATITAAQRMYLAEQYSVPHWIAPAVKDLLQRPILSYSSTEIELLTPAVAFVLAKAQAKFFDTLLTLGHVAPELRHAFHCTGNDRARCEMVWKETWWTKVFQA